MARTSTAVLKEESGRNCRRDNYGPCDTWLHAMMKTLRSLRPTVAKKLLGCQTNIATTIAWQEAALTAKELCKSNAVVGWAELAVGDCERECGELELNEQITAALSDICRALATRHANDPRLKPLLNCFARITVWLAKITKPTHSPCGNEQCSFCYREATRLIICPRGRETYKPSDYVDLLTDIAIWMVRGENQDELSSHYK